MEIATKKEGTRLELALKGRLDTTTAPQLEAELKEKITDVEELVLNFADLSYISSAGLRVILSAQKIMNRQGCMMVCNVNEDVMDVFEVTGFIDILHIR